MNFLQGLLQHFKEMRYVYGMIILFILFLFLVASIRRTTKSTEREDLRKQSISSIHQKDTIAHKIRPRMPHSEDAVNF